MHIIMAAYAIGICLTEYKRFMAEFAICLLMLAF
jgi:hypothetical protein